MTPFRQPMRLMQYTSFVQFLYLGLAPAQLGQYTVGVFTELRWWQMLLSGAHPFYPNGMANDLERSDLRVQ